MRRTPTSPSMDAAAPASGRGLVRVRSGTPSSVAAELRAAVYIAAMIGGFLGATMFLPVLLSLVLHWGAAQPFLVSAIAVGAISAVAGIATRGPAPRLTARFGFIVVNMLWWVAGLICAVPLMLGPADLSVVDAFFEAVSGITTTGSTVMAGLDRTDPATLLWRSMTQWFGGLGILTLGLFLLPYLNVGGMQLFRVESSDRSDKPMPRFVDMSRWMLIVYLALSAACMISYMAVGMTPFDAINHAMTTVSTGGYSTHDASFGYFDDNATLWVGSLFMALGALPFTLYIMLAQFRMRDQIDPQILVFLALIVGTTLILLLGRPGPGAFSFDSLSRDLFNVISVITTTGFAADDYTLWGGLAVPIFFVITFFGGCAGSTAGGLKTYRLIVSFELLRASLKQLSHPHAIFLMRYGRRRVDPEIFRASMVMAVAFIGSMAVLTVALGFCGLDFLTALSGSVTALANVGPGLGAIIGPAGNFSPLPDAAKLILALGMILGRLEILSVLVLLSPSLWRD